ncbi:MAG: phage baseplate assembly protein V, partial [bacterium]
MIGRGTDRMERLESQYYGKHRGVVIANDDPQQLGRLRVWVPSLFPTDDASQPAQDDLTVTDWAWPCLPFGGAPDQGFFFVPEVGSKVWVEYEEGNLDSPIWVGTFWSAPGGTTEIPTEAKAMENNEPKRRVIRTSSGHVLEFCDIDGKESITLRHKDGATLSMDEHGSLTIGNKEGTFLYLNAQDTELSFADKNGNNVRLGDKNVTLTNAEGTVVDIADKAVQIVAKNVMLRSDTVSLGEGG